jgi:hypothetical protein
MLLSVHGTHSNNLSGDVDGNGALQDPTRISRNESIQIPHSAFCAPDKCVRTGAGTIAVPNDCSQHIDRRCATPASTRKNAEILCNSRAVPQDSVRGVDVARVRSAGNFAEVVDPNRIAAEPTRQRTDRLHTPGTAPKEASVCHSRRGAVANHLSKIVDIVRSRVRETRQHPKTNHSRRLAPDKRVQLASCTEGRISDHLAAGIDCHRGTSIVAGQRAEILHSSRTTTKERMRVSAAARQIRLTYDQAADIDSRGAAMTAAGKRPQISRDSR